MSGVVGDVELVMQRRLSQPQTTRVAGKGREGWHVLT